MARLNSHIKTFAEAEENAARHMRALGHRDARVTPGGSDGGLDVVARRAVAQVKWMQSQVGRPDLQRLFGARGTATHREMWFFAHSGYTPKAVAYADEVQMLIFSFDSLGRLEPRNALARTKLRQSRIRADLMTSSSAHSVGLQQTDTRIAASFLLSKVTRRGLLTTAVAVFGLLLGFMGVFYAADPSGTPMTRPLWVSGIFGVGMIAWLATRATHGQRLRYPMTTVIAFAIGSIGAGFSMLDCGEKGMCIQAGRPLVQIGIGLGFAFASVAVLLAIVSVVRRKRAAHQSPAIQSPTEN